MTDLSSGHRRKVNRFDRPPIKVLDPLDPDDDTRPLYTQVADRIREAIRAGRLLQAKPIPSPGAIATYYGVNDGTVWKAIKVLADEGLLHAVKGVGTFVSGMPPDEPHPQHARKGNP